jgi:signal transduction histidine kinase
MKNALGGILDNLNDIIKLNSLKGNDRSIFNKRKTEIENSLNLVRSVLSIFKFREGQNKKSYINIPEIIQATINFFKIRNDDIEYVITSEPMIPGILFQEAEFSMIIYNLIYNSIAALDIAKRENGKIQLHVALSKDKQNFIITIEDNGIGIKHENDENIYLPDFSTAEGGTGLGLYYVSKTLEEYSGSIEHHSVYREYAKFILTIPLSINYS